MDLKMTTDSDWSDDTCFLTHPQSQVHSHRDKRSSSSFSSSSILMISSFVILCLVNCVLCYHQPIPPPSSSDHHRLSSSRLSSSRLPSSPNLISSASSNPHQMFPLSSSFPGSRKHSDHLITSSSDTSSSSVFGRRTNRVIMNHDTDRSPTDMDRSPTDTDRSPTDMDRTGMDNPGLDSSLVDDSDIPRKSEDSFHKSEDSFHKSEDDERRTEETTAERRSDSVSLDSVEDPTVPIAILGSDLEYSDTLNGEMKDTDQQVLYINHGDGAVSSIRRSFAASPVNFNPHVSSYPSSVFDGGDTSPLIKDPLIKDSLTRRSDNGNGISNGHNSVTGTSDPSTALNQPNSGTRGNVASFAPSSQPHSSNERRIGGEAERRIGGAEERRIGGAEERRIGGAEERRIGGAVEDGDDYIDPGHHHSSLMASLFPDDIPRLFTRRAGQHESQGQGDGHGTPLTVDDRSSFAPPENSFGSSFDDAPTEPPEGSSQTDNPRYNEHHSFSIRHPSPSDRSGSSRDDGRRSDGVNNGNNNGVNNGNNNFSPFFPANPFLGQVIGNNGANGQTLSPDSFFNLFNPVANGATFPPLPLSPPPPATPSSGNNNRGAVSSFTPLTNFNADLVRNPKDGKERGPSNDFQRRRLTNDNAMNSIGVYPSSYNFYRGSGNNLIDTDDAKWPKIFKFTDGRINLNDFEKDKKMGRIKFSSRDRDFDNVRRDSFLILHGGTFS